MFIVEWDRIYGLMLILYVIPALLFLFRKIWNLSPIERFLLGIVVSFLGVSFITTIISYILGSLSIISIGISYILYLGLVMYVFVLGNRIVLEFSMNKEEIIAGALLLILLISNWNLRMLSFSPIYYEFDPYFYLDGVKYLLNHGRIPVLDDSAWYPYNVSTHRNPPMYHYTIGSWYYLIYGNSVDNLKLSAIGNFFPPLNAVFMILSMYLLAYLLSGDRKLSLVFSYFVSLIPIFILKFQAGVFEYQPFNFFIFSFLLTSLALYLKTKDLFSGAIVGLAYGSTLLGAVAIPAILLPFIISTGIAYLKYRQEIENMFVGIAVFGLIAGGFMFIYADSLSRALFGILYSGLYVVSRYRLLELIPQINVMNRTISREMFLGGFILLAALFFTFLFRESLLYALQYNTPLERTIAEQNPSGNTLDDNFGKLGLGAMRISERDVFASIWKVIILIIADIPSLILNSILGFVFDVGKAFNLVIEWIPKESSIAYAILMYSILFYIYEIVKGMTSKQISLSDELIISLPMLAFSIGLLKAKFEIYFTFGYLIIFLYFLIKVISLTINGKYTKYIAYFMYAIPVLFAGFSGVTAIDTFSMLLRSNFITPISNNPVALQDLKATGCGFYGFFPDCNSSQIEITTQYNRVMCDLDLMINHKNDSIRGLLYSISCNSIPIQWYGPMQYLKLYTEPSARIVSWWDYGHWINYWADRKAVVRNDHSVLDMILDVAYSYIIGSEKDLLEVMDRYGADYALFDQEIIIGGETLFGGKFYALNYLSCAKVGGVDERFPMLSSRCEFNNLWETVIISNERCNINNRVGRVGYMMNYTGYTGSVQQEPVKKYCVVSNDGSLNLSRATSGFVRAIFGDRNSPYIMYRLNDSLIHRGIPVPISQNSFVMLYTSDRVWFVDGEWTHGYEDRTRPFYESTLYRAFVLERLNGFQLVYNNGYVKIYKRV